MRSGAGLAGPGSLKIALDKSIDRAEQRCTDTDDAGHYLTMLRREKQGEMLGVFPPAQTDLIDARGIKSCLTFQLQMDSTIIFDTANTGSQGGNREKIVDRLVAWIDLVYQGSGSGGLNEEACAFDPQQSYIVIAAYARGGPMSPAEAAAAARFEQCFQDFLTGKSQYQHRPGASYTGQGQLAYVSATTTLTTYGGCSPITVTGTGAGMSALALITITGPGSPAIIDLTITPLGTPSELSTQSCEGQTFTSHTTVWYKYFLRLHQPHHCTWTKWTSPVGNFVYATATDNLNNTSPSSLGVTEKLVLELIHCRKGACPLGPPH